MLFFILYIFITMNTINNVVLVVMIIDNIILEKINIKKLKYRCNMNILIVYFLYSTLNYRFFYVST